MPDQNSPTERFLNAYYHALGELYTISEPEKRDLCKALRTDIRNKNSIKNTPAINAACKILHLTSSTIMYQFLGIIDS